MTDGCAGSVRHDAVVMHLCVTGGARHDCGGDAGLFTLGHTGISNVEGKPHKVALMGLPYSRDFSINSVMASMNSLSTIGNSTVN
jgi:hypothetical protein